VPPFILDVYDENRGLGEKDDFLGRSTLFLKDIAYSVDDTIPKPKWHNCHLKPGAPACGEILVSFSIVALDYPYRYMLNYVKLMEQVNFDEYDVNINVLGLRDLQSIGIFPVKKPYIVFHMNSLVPPEEGQ
jgi:hypothetical protein